MTDLQKRQFKKNVTRETPQTNSCRGLMRSEPTQRLTAGVDVSDSFSAAGADDFDPIARNPTGQQVTVATATMHQVHHRERKKAGEMPVRFKCDR